ncbi:hypothetical protein Tco_1505622 [Tanacetum coccineum]
MTKQGNFTQRTPQAKKQSDQASRQVSKQASGSTNTPYDLVFPATGPSLGTTQPTVVLAIMSRVPFLVLTLRERLMGIERIAKGIGNSATADIKVEGNVVLKLTSGKELKLENVLFSKKFIRISCKTRKVEQFGAKKKKYSFQMKDMAYSNKW